MKKCNKKCQTSKINDKLVKKKKINKKSQTTEKMSQTCEKRDKK